MERFDQQTTQEIKYKPELQFVLAQWLAPARSGMPLHFICTLKDRPEGQWRVSAGQVGRTLYGIFWSTLFLRKEVPGAQICSDLWAMASHVQESKDS